MRGAGRCASGRCGRGLLAGLFALLFLSAVAVEFARVFLEALVHLAAHVGVAGLGDALGREVARPLEGAVQGVVEASVDVSALPAGLYVARLTVGDRAETVRLSVVR